MSTEFREHLDQAIDQTLPNAVITYYTKPADSDLIVEVQHRQIDWVGHFRLPLHESIDLKPEDYL